MVCSVLLTACSGNGAYVNSVSLEPTFEPSVHPLAVRPLRRGAGRRRRDEEEGVEGGRQCATANGRADDGAAAMDGFRECRVFCVGLGGWGARGFYIVLEQFPHEGANLLFESMQMQ